MDGVLAVSFIIFVICIVIDYYAAKEFQHIAEMKGHPGNKYFWWCFWVGIIGWPMVIALPDRGQAQPQPLPQAADDLPDL